MFDYDLILFIDTSVGIEVVQMLQNQIARNHVFCLRYTGFSPGLVTHRHDSCRHHRLTQHDPLCAIRIRLQEENPKYRPSLSAWIPLSDAEESLCTISWRLLSSEQNGRIGGSRRNVGRQRMVGNVYMRLECRVVWTNYSVWRCFARLLFVKDPFHLVVSHVHLIARFSGVRCVSMKHHP